MTMDEMDQVTGGATYGKLDEIGWIRIEPNPTPLPNLCVGQLRLSLFEARHIRLKDCSLRKAPRIRGFSLCDFHHILKLRYPPDRVFFDYIERFYNQRKTCKLEQTDQTALN